MRVKERPSDREGENFDRQDCAGIAAFCGNKPTLIRSIINWQSMWFARALYSTIIIKQVSSISGTM